MDAHDEGRSVKPEKCDSVLFLQRDRLQSGLSKD